MNRRPKWLSLRSWIDLRLVGGGFTDKQIALVMGISLETAKEHYRRSKKKLLKQGYVVYERIDVAKLIEQGVF